MYTFTYEEDKVNYSNDFSDENVTMSFTTEVTLDEILSKFERFLQASGWQWIEPNSIQHVPTEEDTNQYVDSLSLDDTESHSYSSSDYIFNPDDFHYPYNVTNLNLSMDDNITFTTDWTRDNSDQLSFDFMDTPYEYGDVTFTIGEKVDTK